MDDARFVSGVDRPCERGRQPCGCLSGLRRPSQYFIEAPPFQQLECDERKPPDLADIEDLDDVRVPLFATASASILNLARSSGLARLPAESSSMRRIGSNGADAPCRRLPCRRDRASPESRSRRPWEVRCRRSSRRVSIRYSGQESPGRHSPGLASRRRMRAPPIAGIESGRAGEEIAVADPVSQGFVDDRSLCSHSKSRESLLVSFLSRSWQATHDSTWSTIDA